MAARAGRIGLQNLPREIEQAALQRGELPARAQPAARKRHLHLVAGILLLCAAVTAALAAPLLTPYAPDAINAGVRLSPPSAAHLFGTDAFGRDLFTRVVYGARLALKLSVLSVFISAVPGILLGLAAGFYRGWVDQVVSRLIDAWLSLPGLLLALLVIARTGPSLDGAILALGITGVPGFYRLVRSGTISLCQLPYVEAARSVGVPDGRLMLRHILPNLLSSIVVLTTMRLGTFLLAGGGLSFIGLGAQPPDPEWGAMLAEGRDYYSTAWWLFAFPAGTMILTVMGFNLLGDGLRDQLAEY